MRTGLAICVATAGAMLAASASAEPLETAFITGCVETFPDVRAANAVLKDAGFSQDGNNLTSLDGNMTGGAHMLAEDSIAYCALTGDVADKGAMEISVLTALMEKWPEATITSYPEDTKGRTSHVMVVRDARVVFGATQSDLLGEGKVMLDLLNESPMSELTQ